MPSVLALYNTIADLGRRAQWATRQHDHLVGRGMIDSTGEVLPHVAELLHHLASAEEELHARCVPLEVADTMLRVAITCRRDRFMAASRTREVFLVQPVAAADWAEAALKVFDAQLGSLPPASLSTPLQLSSSDARKLGDYAAGGLTDYLIDLGLNWRDAEILNAASEPVVATELTATRRFSGTKQMAKTSVSVLDTRRGRIIGWPFTGPDQRTWITYAEGAPHRLATAIKSLFEQVPTP